MCAKISAMLPEGVDATATAQELTLDLLTFADQAAGFIMSVLMEEMLHLSLSSNVKSAIFGTTEKPSPPPLMDLGNLRKLDGFLGATPVHPGANCRTIPRGYAWGVTLHRQHRSTE